MNKYAMNHRLTQTPINKGGCDIEKKKILANGMEKIEILETIILKPE
jgi:hypothetical protein